MAQTRLSIGLNSGLACIKFRAWITVQRNCSRFKQREILVQIVILHIIFVQFLLSFLFFKRYLRLGASSLFCLFSKVKIVIRSDK